MFGLGAMIAMLGGNEKTAMAAKAAIGKTIASAHIEEDSDGTVVVDFTDGSRLRMWDAGRSCCESRYVTTDDDLADLAGQVVASIEVADMGSADGECGEPHDMQSLRILTDGLGATFVTHNEHNGYYGGFVIRARLDTSDAVRVDGGDQ